MRSRTICGIFMLISLIPIAAVAQDDTPAKGKQNRQAVVVKGMQIVDGIDVAQLTEGIDRVMNHTIETKGIPGGVVLIQRDGKPILRKAYGRRSIEPTSEPCTVDTIYDMASLTKCLATAGSVMKLVEEGKISLQDRVSKYIPDWQNSKEDESLVENIRRVRRGLENGEIHLGGEPTLAPDASSATRKAWNVMKSKVGLKEEAMERMLAFPPVDKSHVTLRMLITHTAGLKPFDRFYLKYPERHAHDKIIHDIATMELQAVPGTEFIYSDLGFITLGDIVQRVSGEGLDKFATENFFKPLGMKDTMYNPPVSLKPRIAPTQYRIDTLPDGTTKSVMMRGDVHDGNAWVQDGVSGHAGLFSTVDDVGRYCQMLINGGTLDGVRVLSPVTVAAMTRDQARLGPDGDERGLGWDINTGYSNLRGDLFKGGFGHTGFTGTSIWVVPKEKLAIIILTNRVHPDGNGETIPMRIRVANVVAGSIVTSYVREDNRDNQN